MYQTYGGEDSNLEDEINLLEKESNVEKLIFKNSNNYFHTYYFLPTEGRMLLFPSHLQHEVFENKSNEDRISVSFNINLIDG